MPTPPTYSLLHIYSAKGWGCGVVVQQAVSHLLIPPLQALFLFPYSFLLSSRLKTQTQHSHLLFNEMGLQKQHFRNIYDIKC